MKEQAKSLFAELEKYTLTDFLTTESMQKFSELFKTYRDCDFTTYGRIDDLKNVCFNNIPSVDDIKQLKNVILQLDIC